MTRASRTTGAASAPPGAEGWKTSNTASSPERSCVCLSIRTLWGRHLAQGLTRPLPSYVSLECSGGSSAYA